MVPPSMTRTLWSSGMLWCFNTHPIKNWRMVEMRWGIPCASPSSINRSKVTGWSSVLAVFFFMDMDRFLADDGE